MVRKYHRDTNRITEVRQSLAALQDSPLATFRLGEALNEFLDLTLPQSLNETLSFASGVLERLPKNYDRRFFFDAYLIGSIIETCGRESVNSALTVLPTYCDTAWGHEYVPVSFLSRNTFIPLNLISIPEGDPLDPPYLLEYPWLYHELGHCLLVNSENPLTETFLPPLNDVLSRLTLRSIPDKGDARNRAKDVIDDIRMHWEPSKSQRGWLFEIAIDTIALWSCGPAYLATFNSAHDQVADPFHIEQSHPPVELRAHALIETAVNLGWQEYTGPLEERQIQWNSQMPSAIQNRYATLRNIDLITSSIHAAINYCRKSGIRRFEVADLDRIRQDLGQIENIDGADLIVAAWLYLIENGEAAYDVWEKEVFEVISDELIQ